MVAQVRLDEASLTAIGGVLQRALVPIVDALAQNLAVLNRVEDTIEELSDAPLVKLNEDDIANMKSLNEELASAKDAIVDSIEVVQAFQTTTELPLLTSINNKRPAGDEAGPSGADGHESLALKRKREVRAGWRGAWGKGGARPFSPLSLTPLPPCCRRRRTAST